VDAGRGRLFTVGSNKQLHAFDKQTGEVLWSHDLVADFDAPPTLIRPAVKAGYAASPTAYQGLVIVTAGGPGQSVMAFRQDDGALVWRSGSFLISPATPILVDVDGQIQLIVYGGRTINVKTGEAAWRERGYGRSSLVYADGKAIILSEDGTLMLATLSPDGFTMLSAVALFDTIAWTAPTLVGTTLYVRDRARIMALDLGGN